METLVLVKEWLTFITAISATAIDAIALAIVIYGTTEATMGSVRLITGSSTGVERRDVWLRFARWLVAALTFQLASDIIETAIAPSWDEVAKFAVIAVIRTLLNYFLERDLSDVRDRQHGTVTAE